MGKRLPSVSLSAWRGLSDSVCTILNQHRKSLKALHSIVKYYRDHPRHEAIFIKQKTGMHVVHEYTHHWFSESSMTSLAGWHSNSGEFEMKDMWWLPPSGLKQSGSQSSSFIFFLSLICQNSEFSWMIDIHRGLVVLCARIQTHHPFCPQREASALWSLTHCVIASILSLNSFAWLPLSGTKLPYTCTSDWFAFPYTANTYRCIPRDVSDILKMATWKKAIVVK